MTTNAQISPWATTSAQGQFSGPSTTGVVQGQADPDPATRYQLRTGILAASETLPMWGGVAVQELIPGRTANAIAPSSHLGPQIARATSISGAGGINGFSVFDQAYAMINSPQSTVPLATAGSQVMTYRMGSGARIAVACDPLLVSLWGSRVNIPVAWDFVNQQLIPFTGALTIASTGSSYNSTTGIVSLATTAPHGISPGDTVIVSGATGTGADLALVNGTYTALAGTTGSTINYAIATGKTISTITGGAVTTGGTALPVDVLNIYSAGSMTVNYNATTGFANWNYNGAAAVIQLVKSDL